MRELESGGEVCLDHLSLSLSSFSLSLSSFFSSCCLCKVLMQDYNFHIINIYTNNGISDDLRNYFYFLLQNSTKLFQNLSLFATINLCIFKTSLLIIEKKSFLIFNVVPSVSYQTLYIKGLNVCLSLSFKLCDFPKLLFKIVPHKCTVSTRIIYYQIIKIKFRLLKAKLPYNISMFVRPYVKIRPDIIVSYVS